MKFFILGVLLLEICTLAYSQGRPECYGRVCPYGTESCRKHSKSSGDNSYIEVRIACLDPGDGILTEHRSMEPRSSQPGTFYESTSYATVNNNNPAPIRYQQDPLFNNFYKK